MSGFKPYPAYKDSGVEWLGEVPTHWESWKVSHAYGELGSGTTPPTTESEWYENGTVPWVTTGELRESVILETKKLLSPKALSAFPALRLHPAGSLAIAMYGATIGRLGILGVDATVNQACCLLIRPNYLNVKFTFYWLLVFKKSIIDLFASGGGQPNINQEIIANLKIPAPGVHEQAQIARFLDHETARIDALIEEQQRLIELLKEKRQAVISHAVTKGLDPTVPMKDSGVEWLGEVPAHWVCSELKRFASVQGGYAFPSDLFGDAGIAVIRIGDIQSDGTVNLVGCKRIEGGGEEYSRFQVVRGDLLMAMTGATIGKAGWYDDNEPAYLNQRVGVFRSGVSLVMDFLYYITQSSGYQEHIKLTAYGGAQPNISDTGMLSYFSAVPPIEEQMEICRYLNDVLKHLSSIVAETERSLSYLQERRSALISAAVTGKIDVRNWQPPAGQYPAGDTQNRTEPEVV